MWHLTAVLTFQSGEHRENTNYIWNWLESNFYNKLNNLIDSITLYPMLADYELPEGDVDPIQLLFIPINPVMDRFNSRFSQD